jgi:hypothetical protein
VVGPLLFQLIKYRLQNNTYVLYYKYRREDRFTPPDIGGASKSYLVGRFLAA